MSPPTPQQQVEIFHLLFLRHLESRLDKSLYALKGGCNLRFFMRSIRYSEDMDLDIKIVATGTLQKKVNALLEARPFQEALRAKGIEIQQHSSPKQTDTTQRWKIQLKMAGTSLPVPTKIEFSRRGLQPGVEFGPVEPELIREYQLYQTLCSHYSKDAACQQKLEALVGRSEMQARDLFDLKLLFDLGARPLSLEKPLVEKLRSSMDAITQIDFAIFKSQVVAYLAPSYQDYYASPTVWHQINADVKQNILGLL